MTQAMPITFANARGTAAQYVWAVAAVAVATLVRWLLDPTLGDHLPFVTFFLAVLFAGWFTGLLPSIVALITGALVGEFLFVAPRYTPAFHLDDPQRLTDVARYMIVSAAIIGVCEAMRRARHRVLEEAERWRTTVASIGDGVITTDAGGRINNMNSVAEALTGWTSGEAQGVPLTEVFRIVNESTRLEVDNPALRALKEGVIVGLANHTLLIAKDGTERPIDDSAAPIRSASGAILGSVLVFRDISERLHAQAEHRAVQAQMTATLDSVTDGLMRYDREWRVLYVNAEAERINHFSRTEMLGRIVWELFPAIVGTKLETEFRRAVSEKVTVEFENYYEPFGRWYSLKGYPTPDGGLTTFIRDITEQKRVEQRLIESEARYRAIGESIDYGVWVCDAEGRNTYASESFLRLVGLTQTQYSEYGWRDVLHPDDAEATIAAWKECVRTHGTWDRVHRFKGVDGNVHYVLARGVPLRDGAGRNLGWAGINLDISRMLEAEQEVSRIAAESDRQRRLYETVLTNTPDFIYVFSLDHKVVYANDALIKMWGRGRDGAIGKTFLEIGYEPWHAEMHCREIDQVRATRQPIRGEVPFNGTLGRRQYDYIFVPVIGADGEVEAVAGTTRDVTERKETERQLRDGQDQLDFALAAAQLGQWSLNLADHTASRTLRHDQIFGYDALLPEWTYEMFLEHVVPDDRTAVDANFQKSIATGSAWEVECRIRRADGVVRHIWTKALIRRDAEGQVERMVGIVGDITQRRQAEERQAFLVRLADTLRPLSDPVDVQAKASRVLGEYLGANRVVYFEIRGDEYVIERDFTSGVQPLTGRYPVASFGSALLAVLLDGRTVIEADATTEPDRSPGERAAFAGIQVRGHVDVPLVKGGRFVAGMSVQVSDRRDWTRHEVSLIEETAERTWAAVERVRAEAALRESEQRFRLLADAAPVMIWMSGRDKLVSWYNRAWLDFTGRSMEQEVGDGAVDLVHPDDLELCLRTYAAAFEARTPFSMEYRLRRHDGEFRWLSCNGVPRHREDGEFEGYIGSCLDVTDYKNAEAALRQSEERSAFVRRSSGVGFWYCDLPFDVLQWDDKVKEHFGLPPEHEVTIDTFYERLHPDDRASTRTSIEKSINEHTGYDIQYRTVGLDGRERWINAIGRTGYNDEGKAIRFDGITLDITERKNAERDLAEATRRTESALMAGEMGTYYWEIKTNVMYGDKNFARIFGVETDERGAAPLEAFLAVIHPDDLDDVRSRIQATLSHNAPYEAEYRILAGGSERWVVARGSVERDADGIPVGWAGAIVEITGRKQAERQLMESERRRRLAFDAAELGSWNINPAANTLVSDERFREIFHGSAAPLTYEQAFAAIHPDDRTRIRESMAAAVRPENPVPYAEEYRIVLPDGTVRWVYAKGRAAFEGEGPAKRLVSFDGTVADISAEVHARLELAASEERYRRLAATLEEQVERRTAELEASHRQLQISERMAALGTLSAGLGHDMGNLLVPVRVRLEALTKADLPEPSRKDVEAIQTSAEYLRKLSAGLRLLALNPDHSAAGEATELRSWWEEAEPMLRNVLPHGIVLASRLPEEKCWAGISRPAITQAVFNLVQNAGDAMRDSGSGTVTVWIESRSDVVLVGVTDDGPGMPPEVKARCMEPFYTTKPRDISTGLGLALVYALTQEAKGTISIDTAPGKGTTFALTLPNAGPGVLSGKASQPPRTAAVSLREPRLQAFVTAELRTLSFKVEKDVSITADLFVIDDLSKIDGNAKGRPIVFIGPSATSEHKDVIVLGEKPPLQTVRETLRTAAERGAVA